MRTSEEVVEGRGSPAGPPLPDGWTPFETTTRDGVRIAGVHSPRTSDAAVVLGHGFLGSWRRPQNVHLARSLSARFGAVLFDFRGHGGSGGESTVGDREALDVHAVVGATRDLGWSRVVTVGASMGAISALRSASRFHDVDGVVSISAPGRWAGHGPIARTAGLLVTTRGGRAFARRALGTRVCPVWRWTPPPAEVVEQIAAPVLIVHGRDDRFIPPAQADLLFAKARRPKRLFVLDGFGHAELGYTPAFARLLADQVEGMLSEDGWGREAEGRLGWRDAAR